MGVSSLLKPCQPERRQILVAFGFALEGHFAGKPRKRQIRLDAEQGFEGYGRQLALFGHRSGGCEDAVGTDEVGTKTQRLARQADGHHHHRQL